MDELLAEARELHRRIIQDPQRKRQIIQEFYDEKVKAGQRDTAELVLIILNIEMANPPNNPSQGAPKWLQKAGIAFGAFTLLFFMAIVLLGIAGREVPPSTKFALVAVLGLGSAFSASAWIGSVTLSGDLASPKNQKPLFVTAAGGFATFIIVFILGYSLYIR